MHFPRICLTLILALAPSSGWGEHWSTSGDGLKCVPLRDADAVKLWIAADEPDERKAAVEGSRNRGAKRDLDGPALFFEVQLRADSPSQRCMRLGWRVKPWGPNPVDMADFGGRFPAGTIDVIYGAHHDEAVGALQLWVPDDHIREDAETFRIVLLDPVTRSPLGGTIGAFDPETGMRARRRTPQSLGMENRLVMTVLDAAAQRPRKSSR